MNKRLTKSEHKREVKKKKLKKRRKLHKKEVIQAEKEAVPPRRSPVFAFLLTGLTLFNFFPFSGKTVIPSALSERETAPAVLSASVTAPVKKAPAPTPAELKQAELKREVLAIVAGTPMEKMADDISKRNRTVAAYIVAIAMKESKFGVYSPKEADGTDCYNYWGYRGQENPTLSGYSCFASPSQAVKVVGDRIQSLVDQGVKTPSEMVVWKCGYTCDGFPAADVQSWISDVGINYYRLNTEKAGKQIADNE